MDTTNETTTDGTECSTTCVVKIDIDQVEEIYDSLSTKIRTDLQKDYDCKKINGTTFAQTWENLMKTVVSSALSAVVSMQNNETDADRCLKYAQCDEIAKESSRKDCLAQADCALKTSQQAKVDYETNEILPEQKAFTIRQTQGFDDNKEQKMLEIQMNAWAMMFSSGLMGETVPSIISGDATLDLYNTMGASLGLPQVPEYFPPVEAPE